MGIHNDVLYLQHILEAISRINGYVRNIDYDQFKQDEKTVRAVLYDLAVIGEAARVEYPTVWKTLQQDLPELKQMVEDLV